MHKNLFRISLLPLSLLFAGCGDGGPPPEPAAVDGARIENADSEPGSWLAHGRTYSEQRYSPLDQINESNVAQLGLAWYYDLDTNRAQQASPLIIDGRLYTTSAWSKVQAFEAATGELLWQFDPGIDKSWDIKTCCGVQNRGVAAWLGLLYVGTLDGRLIALDAEDGSVVWEQQTTDQSQRYSITGAPRVVKGKVIIGNGGAEYGVRGYVTAYDAATGDQVWRFYTVPGNPADGFETPEMEMAAKTWTGEWWVGGGGGTAWDGLAFDPELDLLYIGTGNGSPWPRKLRSPDGGDNLFLSSIVAVRPDTGEYVWHYQTTPGDTWDYTATQPIVLADLEIDGQTRQVLMQAPKNGFFYVLDRATGELISAEKFMPINWATHVDMETGRPVETPFARYDDLGKPAWITPGPQGAHNWHPMAFHPGTGLVYLPIHQAPMLYNVDMAFERDDVSVNLGLNLWDEPETANNLDEFEPIWQGHLLAWDPVNQTEVWRKQHDDIQNGGVLATAGNLVFQGTGSSEFRAYRADTGQVLWSSPTQTGILAPPVTYTVDGEQYVVLVAGWGGPPALVLPLSKNPDVTYRNISRVLVYKLGGSATLPDPPPPPIQMAAPPDVTDEAAVARGNELFARRCVSCHGVTAIGGILPDLRFSPMIVTAEGFDTVVRQGALESLGMVSFAEVLTPEDAEAIRAYLIRRANEAEAEDE